MNATHPRQGKAGLIANLDNRKIHDEGQDSMQTTTAKKIRVGFFTYGMNDRLTGIGRYTKELTYALRDQYPDLEIILISPYPESPLTWYRDFDTHYVPQLKRLPMVMLRGSSVLAKLSRRLDLDILHDPCGIAPFLGRWPKKTRKVVTIHDAIPLHHPEYQPLLTRLVFRTLLPKSRRTADAICTDSQNASQDLRDAMHFNPSQVHVTYPGVRAPQPDDLQAWRDQEALTRSEGDLPQHFFLFVSAMNPRKNVKRLIEAFLRVHAIHSDTALVLAGPASAEISRFVQQVNPRDQAIRLLDYVDDDHLHRLYTAATAVVYPSLYEGFGLPALEAMAHDTPIITSSTSSLPEVVDTAGWLVDPTDVAALAKAMVEVLTHPNPRKLHHEAAQTQVRKFSWEATAHATRQVYDGVLGQ